MTRHWTVLPNFVDCLVFRPVEGPAEKCVLRSALGVSEDAIVIGCVAAVKKGHKRIDYLIREFSSLQNSSLRSFLLIAGAKTGETDELVALAEALIPGRYKILTDCTRDRMPDLYRAMDVFVLTSLFEMMPIALLEALASGLPCFVNQHPVLEWMTGAHQTTGQEEEIPLCGGLAIDMSKAGALEAALAGLTPEWIVEHGRAARERAVQMFSKEVVIGQYVAYYEEVIDDVWPERHVAPHCVRQSSGIPDHRIRLDRCLAHGYSGSHETTRSH